MPTKIYVLHGSEGEYSDRDEWIVGAFESEAEAQALCDAACAAAREFLNKNGAWSTAYFAARKAGPRDTMSELEEKVGKRPVFCCEGISRPGDAFWVTEVELTPARSPL